MFQRLLDMYVENKINQNYLEKAVKVGWINASEMDEIIEFKKIIDLQQT